MDVLEGRILAPAVQHPGRVLQRQQHGILHWLRTHEPERRLLAWLSGAALVSFTARGYQLFLSGLSKHLPPSIIF